MSAALPRLIQNYVDASNAHEVQSILACFADDATVHDENTTHRGKIDIERWATETIERYKFQFKPLSTEELDREIVVRVEILFSKPRPIRLPLRNGRRKNCLAHNRFVKRLSVTSRLE